MFVKDVKKQLINPLPFVLIVEGICLLEQLLKEW